MLPRSRQTHQKRHLALRIAIFQKNSKKLPKFDSFFSNSYFFFGLTMTTALRCGTMQRHASLTSCGVIVSITSIASR